MGRDKTIINMNCNSANQISIISFLHQQGINPARLNNREAWYLSPIRNEYTPSFKVDIQLNRWYDHGLGQGGKLVDLGTRILGITVKEFLQQLNSSAINSFPIRESSKITSNEIVLTKVQPIEHSALLDYLIVRRIDKLIANRYCSQIHYSISSKSFFGIGFKNDKNGIEVRNPFFKGCIGNKGISTLLKDTSSFDLFEGFFDFMTAIQLNLVSESQSAIILNSVNQIEKALNLLGMYKPVTIKSYFDNDQAGRNCFLSLKQKFPYAIDQSSLYENHKDLSEMICKNH